MKNIKLFLVSLLAMLNEFLFTYQVRTGMILSALPSLAEAKRMSTTGAGLEGIRQSIYDTLIYPAAGQAQLGFFATPLNQGVSSATGVAAGSPKSIADTNLNVAGMLPAGKAFLMTSIEAAFYAGSAAVANQFTLSSPVVFAAVAAAALEAQAADVNTFYMSGSLQLYISSKVCLEEAPLLRFPPKATMDIDGAIASNSATTAAIGTVQARAKGRPYMMEPQIYLEPSVNFNVNINYPVVVPMPSGFNGKVQLILDGYLYRLG